MLIVWNAASRASRRLLPLLHGLPTGEERFHWRKREGSGDLAIGYAILRPKWSCLRPRGRHNKIDRSNPRDSHMQTLFPRGDAADPAYLSPEYK